MRARRWAGGAVAAALLPGAWAGASAVPGPARVAAPPAHAVAAPVSGAPTGYRGFAEEEPDCTLGANPADAQPTAALGGATVPLDVVILVDEVDAAAAQSAAATAARVYAPLDVDLRVTFVELPVPLPSEGPSPYDPERGTIDGDRAMELLKQHFGGVRPPGSDLVYLATAKDLTKTDLASGERDSALAGRADCRSGVMHPAYAFAIGEVEPDVEFSIGPSYLNQGGRVLAHELGHLMGAEHHHGNCAEGDPLVLPAESSVCTVMFPDTFFVGYRFSSVNGAIVRGLAEKYAAG